MTVEQYLSQVSPQRDTVLTVGTFDGVHRGHQQIFQCLKNEALKAGLLAAAVVFQNHPRTILIPEQKIDYITLWPEREALIQSQGIDLVVPFDFTYEFSQVTARDFVTLLGQHLRMKGLVVGPDFALGYQRKGDVPALKALGEEHNFWVRVLDQKMFKSQPIGSSMLRRLIYDGDVEQAAEMLGRLFSLDGSVVEGDHRGKSLGFPTANLGTTQDKLVPGDGIYATWALIDSKRYQSATSIGVRPTFGPGPRAVETFIIDFDGNLYGKTIRLEFVCRLREEKHFPDEMSLVEQMKCDVNRARAILNLDSGKGIDRSQDS